MLTPEEKIALYSTLFCTRRDVFARRWEKPDGSAAGYAPVYTDYARTAYKEMTDHDIENHLRGHVALGVYPLLQDNTSHFIVADFDKKDWRTQCAHFYATCQKYHLPLAIEISRSGNGAHAWCFFAAAYPAMKSRKIFFTLLREAGCIGTYEHNESFDRLFPNQDRHVGKGLGNLIALPLQGKSRKSQCTVFVHPHTFEPIADQWAFLQNITKCSIAHADRIYKKCVSDEDEGLFAKNIFTENSHLSDKKLHVFVESKLCMKNATVPPIVAKHVRDNLNFLNSAYFAKVRSGFSTHTIEKFFKTIDVDDNFVYLPRGYQEKLYAFLREQNIDYTVIDKTTVHEKCDMNLAAELHDYQKDAVAAFDDKTMGVLVAPPAAGKTVMGLALACEKKQPALIITHRQNIFDQWVGSVENFLHISKKDIGRYCAQTKTIKKPVTVAMMQTLARAGNVRDIVGQFGCVIIDECHHVPAKMFRTMVAQIPSRYLFGLTATPRRKYNDEKLIYAYIGDVVQTVTPQSSQESDKSTLSPKKVHVLESDFAIPYTIGTSHFAHVLKLLSHDISRNALITQNIHKEIAKQRRVLVLCDRVEHSEALWYHLREKADVLVLNGNLSARQKRYRTKRIANGTFQVVIATGHLFGEGTDFDCFDSLFLVSPISFEGKLIQYMGRLRNSAKQKHIFDVRDPQVEILEKSFTKRLRVYKKQHKSGEIILLY